MKKTRLLLLLPTVLTCIISLTPYVANAQTGANPVACSTNSFYFLGLPTWYKYLKPDIKDVNPSPEVIDNACEIQFDVNTDIPKILFAIFEIIMWLLGVVAVVMVVWGGIQYVTSQGEPEATKNARSTIINALIGLAIALSATAIVNLIGNTIF